PSGRVAGRSRGEGSAAARRGQLARRARALRRLRERRSSSDRPPHTPESWPVSSANLRHAVMTSQLWHTAFASWIWVIAGPVFPIGKNSSGSCLRHSAWWRQSIVSLSFQNAPPRPYGAARPGWARVEPSQVASSTTGWPVTGGAVPVRVVVQLFSIVWAGRVVDKGLHAPAGWHVPHGMTP